MLKMGLNETDERIKVMSELIIVTRSISSYVITTNVLIYGCSIVCRRLFTGCVISKPLSPLTDQM